MRNEEIYPWRCTRQYPGPSNIDEKERELLLIPGIPERKKVFLLDQFLDSFGWGFTIRTDRRQITVMQIQVY